MYSPIFPKPFQQDIKAVKKDKVLYSRLWKKIEEIVKNPEHYPLKKYDLKGKRSAHVGSFVIVFEIEEKSIIFLRFKHHDYAYK